MSALSSPSLGEPDTVAGRKAAGSSIADRSAFWDQLQFVGACFDLAQEHHSFAHIAGETALHRGHIASALDEVLPVLSGIADRLERQAEKLSAWNIGAAGRNEIIARDVERNWTAMRALGIGGAGDGSTQQPS